MTVKKYTLILFILFAVNSLYSQKLFVVTDGQVQFTSDAPLEMIQANAEQVEGVLQPDKKSFAFRVKMKDFRGFNSSLQRTHFNENYLETDKYPYTTFEGKIIEDISLYSPGNHNIRGKGSFVCHGVEQERIIKTRLEVKPDQIKIESDFTVLLADHNIKIPAVVNQKLAEEVSVHVEMILKPKE
jgi:hypothetical protein